MKKGRKEGRFLKTLYSAVECPACPRVDGLGLAVTKKFELYKRLQISRKLKVFEIMNSASNIKPLLKPFGCTLCPLSFALAKSLVKHVEVHKTKLQVGNSKKNFVQKEKKSIQKEKNSVQKEKNSVQREKSSENFVQNEKNSENFVQKEDSKNVKANLKESNVRHRVNSLDFELGSDFYRPFKDNNIQNNDPNESKQSKSTENLKNNKVYAESDKKSNDSIPESKLGRKSRTQIKKHLLNRVRTLA